MRIGNTLPNPIPGAGRFIDYMWPDPTTFAGGSSPGRLRNNQTNPVVAPTFVGLGGGGGSGAGVLNGVPVWQVQSSGVAGNGNAILLSNQRVVAFSSKSALNPAINDTACWRIIWNVAMFAAPALTGESTCCMLTDTNNPKFITGLNEGFGFHFLNDGTVGFATVKGGVLVQTVLTAAPFAYIGVIHSYEMRIFGATSTQEAQLVVLIDSVPLALPATSSNWGAGTKLPATQMVGGIQPGWCPGVVNVANNVNSMYTNMVRVIAGPTADSLF